MTVKLMRRDLLNAVVAALGLLVLGSVVCAAEAEKDIKLPGEWLFDGNKDQPCAIFQHGRILLLVNESGEMATAKMTEPKKFVVLKGWEEGLTGEIVDDGKGIDWSNGTKWKRP
jgi:hypothetical protein